MLLSSFALLACNGGVSSSAGSPPTSLEKPWNGEVANGEINGQRWIYKSGNAHIFRKNLKQYLVLHLWNTPPVEDPCAETKGSILQVRLLFPYRVGDWRIDPQDPFNANLSILFSDRQFQPGPLDNMSADEGAISIFALDKGMVSGYFYGSFKNPKVANTLVQGGFLLPLCKGLVSEGDNF